MKFYGRTIIPYMKLINPQLAKIIKNVFKEIKVFP